MITLDSRICAYQGFTADLDYFCDTNYKNIFSITTNFPTMNWVFS